MARSHSILAPERLRLLLSLAQSGEQRAVPMLMNNFDFFVFAPDAEEKAALAAVAALSGQNFPNSTQ